MIKALPPTDSRFRPDQRALELNDDELAVEEKARLEGGQRERRERREENKEVHRPQWFNEVRTKGMVTDY